MSFDETTRYLGLTLRSPLVASASPLTGNLDGLRQLEDAGAAAAVLPSLFEEQIVHEEQAAHQLYDVQSEFFAESLTFFPELNNYNTGPENYLEKIRSAKQAVDIPIIASLNGSSRGGWTRYARLIEQAGADALELNIYIVPTETAMTAEEVEQRYVDLVRAVSDTITIPLAVKVGPFFSSIPNMAVKLIEAGANGLVLFNRYLEPDIDLETLHVVPHLVLSSREEMRLPLRWIGILRSQLPRTSLAATSGIHTASDVLKMLLAGADVVMLASALLQRGPAYLNQLRSEMLTWLSEHEYESVEQMKGSVSMKNCPNPEGYLRPNYMKAIVSYSSKFV